MSLAAVTKQQGAALAPRQFWGGEILEEQEFHSLDIQGVHPRLVALGCILPRRPEAIATHGQVQPLLLRHIVLCSRNGFLRRRQQDIMCRCGLVLIRCSWQEASERNKRLRQRSGSSCNAPPKTDSGRPSSVCMAPRLSHGLEMPLHWPGT